MSTQQIIAAPAYRASSMDKFLMRFTLMRALVEWVRAHKNDTRPLVRFAARNSANSITAVRLAFAYPVPWLLAGSLVWLNGRHSLINLAFVCGWVFVLGVLFWTDAFDGTLSNQSGIKSRTGEIADPLADKILIGCTVYFLVWAAVQILPHQLLGILIVVVVLVVALDIASAVITVGEELRAKMIQAAPAKTEQWGKRKLFTQCAGIGLLLIGLIIAAAGANTLGKVIVWAAILILALAIMLSLFGNLHHWRNLAGTKLTHIVIALLAPLIGAVSSLTCYFWLQKSNSNALLLHAAIAIGVGSLLFLGTIAVFYLPQARRLKHQPQLV